MNKYFPKSNDDPNNELYGVVDANDKWLLEPVMPDYIGIEALVERMNVCDQLLTGELKLTVPVMARLGIDSVVYENFHVYT